MSTTDIYTNTIATRPASVRVILDQIGPRALATCGARHFVNLGDGLQFSVSRAGRKLVIKLQANDLYCVERVRLTRPTFNVVSEEVETDIDAENLAAAVIRLGDV